MAIDTTATRVTASLLDTLLQMSSMAQQNRWREDEAVLAREFATEQNELNAAAENFRFLRGRRTQLEDAMVGYTLPYKTKKGAEMISGTMESYEVGAKSELTKIDQITQSLGLIADAKTFAGTQADLHGDIIAAGEDELWRDYMLEGGITVGEGGELTGTGEMPKYLETLRTGTEGQQAQYELLKQENYRQSFERSLRSIEEAKNLQQIDQQIYTNIQQAEAAELAIRQGDYAFAIKQNEEFERNMGEMYKNVSLSLRTEFQYISGGIRYKLPDLVAYAASDLNEFIKIKEKFLKDPANAAIADEADAFISGIETAAAAKLDPAEWSVRFQARAYEEFLKLEEYKKRLTKEGKLQDKSLNEMMTDMPQGETQREITRLKARVSGFKRLGLYKADIATLNRVYSMVQMHNDQQAKRLAMDIEISGKVSEEGLGLAPIQDYGPKYYEHLTTKEIKDLEWSFEALNAVPGEEGGAGGAPATIGAKAMSIPAIAALGWTANRINQIIFDAGADIYNVAGVPMNYLTYFLTGYNPGFKGTEVMETLWGWTGAGPEETFAAQHPEWQWLQEMGPIGGTPRFEGSWEQGTVEDSLRQIEEGLPDEPFGVPGGPGSSGL
tara:strand:+ start:1279 stop:3111 length:1833 start_codon:yes stop_codon:yes gene_type:complete